jgi:hypothetical protein
VSVPENVADGVSRQFRYMVGLKSKKAIIKIALELMPLLTGWPATPIGLIETFGPIHWMVILAVDGKTVIFFVFFALLNWILPPFDDELGLKVSALPKLVTIEIPVGSVCAVPSSTQSPPELR